MAMEAQDILNILLSAGGAAVLAAIINAVVNRRKLSAEATEIITKAAAGTVENIRADNTSLRTEVAELRARVETLQAAQASADQRERAHLLSEERWTWHAERWHRYAERLVAQLRAAGVEPEDPPPRWPNPVTAADLD